VRRWNSYHHAAVYLGNGEFIEYTNSNSGITRKRTSWSEFLSDAGLFDQEIYRFHPVIPFKNYKEIIAQLV
jgi:cell wall-associated NlpC family hydrolase